MKKLILLITMMLLTTVNALSCNDTNTSSKPKCYTKIVHGKKTKVCPDKPIRGCMGSSIIDLLKSKRK